MKFRQGITDLEQIIEEDVFYVDKTPFIEKLEDDSPYLMFIRPRRFGKTLLASMLTLYYDINTKDRFQDIFGKLYIGSHPTPKRNSYLVLNFNFSLVDTSRGEEQLEQSFLNHCTRQMKDFLKRYGNLLAPGTEAELDRAVSAADKLDALVQAARERCLPVYVIIDEYDNFANNILAGSCGPEKYARLTHGSGFFRTFFTFLKGGTSPLGERTAIRRIFMTGVSPLVLDDVTSGFNIAKNISCLPEYNALLGFSEADLRRALESIRAEGSMRGTVEEHLAIMRDNYDNYCFNEDVEGERMFSTNMCITYLDILSRTGRPPRQLIDTNTRTDYNKLKHLILLNGRLKASGNLDVLCALAAEGWTEANLVERFPLEELRRRDQFISLLFYMGILTIDGPYRGRTRFRIPNRTVKTILFSYIEESLAHADICLTGTLELERAADAMGYNGDWRSLLEYIHGKIADTTGIRDFIEGERCIQIAHLVTMWPISCYLPRTECEAAKGYLDLVLFPNHTRGVDVPYTYAIEFKYLKEDATDADLQKAIADAKAQLARYATDELVRSECAGTTFTTLAVIYRKWELAYCEANDTLHL